MSQTIILDCAPGQIRPGDLIDQVIEATDLPKREPDSVFMGQWTWIYDDIDPKVWEAAQPSVQARITGLFHSGMIRYGSW